MNQQQMMGIIGAGTGSTHLMLNKNSSSPNNLTRNDSNNSGLLGYYGGVGGGPGFSPSRENQLLARSPTAAAEGIGEVDFSREDTTGNNFNPIIISENHVKRGTRILNEDEMSKLSPKGAVNFNDPNNNGRFVDYESMSFSQKRETMM